jgi:hypothetical protein
VDSWNLTLQHELTSHLYFELAYVGDKGTNVFTESQCGVVEVCSPDSYVTGVTVGSGTSTYYDLSQSSLQYMIGPVPHNDYSNCKGGRAGVFPGEFCISKPGLRSFYLQQPNFNPNLFEIRYFGNNANDNYNSLQAKVVKNFHEGFSLLAHYTWSKGLDHDANYFAIDPRIGYGPDSFDISRRFVLTNIWDLPIGRGRAWFGGIGSAANRFVSGWTISAITIWRTGLPFTPSYDLIACADDANPGDPCRPNRVGLVHITGSREQYFTATEGQALQGSDCVDPTRAFPNGRYCGVGPVGQPVPGPANGPWQRPGAGQIGNVGRDSFTGPGFFQSDIGLAKVIAISERTALPSIRLI